ncbi:hypothetical protein CYMTET_48153 [Cymbomonas tetramitiformis]|uniref:Uncharacterized protein n=1 Tax=Cymbomonas tetramitiformis TaxID=36881 RepID=A0AAE0BUN8_9CHLO|nr:hypothetical protein CYMTET_48153 [Cymbomonas tetramitiformis]
MSAGATGGSEINASVETDNDAPAIEKTMENEMRARDTLGRFARTDDAAKQANKQNEETAALNPVDELVDIADIVDGLAKDVPVEKQRELAKAFEKMTQMQMNIHKKLNEATSNNQNLKNRYEEVRKQNDQMMAERKHEFGEMATQITDALSDIYMQYNGQAMDDTSKEQFNQQLCNNQDFAKTLRGLPKATVAMSAQRQLLNTGTQLREETQRRAELNENQLTSKLREYQRELSSLQNAGASQLMMPTADYVSMSDHSLKTNQTVSVAASQNKYKDGYSSLPPALRDSIKDYDTSCGVGRLVPDDFAGDVGGSKRARIQ